MAGNLQRQMYFTNTLQEGRIEKREKGGGKASSIVHVGEGGLKKGATTSILRNVKVGIGLLRSLTTIQGRETSRQYRQPM